MRARPSAWLGSVLSGRVTPPAPARVPTNRPPMTPEESRAYGLRVKIKGLDVDIASLSRATANAATVQARTALVAAQAAYRAELATLEAADKDGSQ